MDVKRYVANSVAEGLITVREELGKDAMILSVDERPKGADGKVEIVAAYHAPSQPKPAIPRPDIDNLDAQKLLADLYAAQGRPLTQSTSETARPARPASRLKSKLNSARAQLGPRSSQPETGDDIDAWLEPDTQPEREDMEAPLNAGRRSVDPSDLRPTYARMPGYEGAQTMPPEAASLYFYLREIGIEEEIAQEMIERLTAKYDPSRGWNRNKIQDFLSDMVARQIRVDGLLRNVRKKRVVSLIGPTGVGKTTTIAKLATKLVRNRVSVGLITVDHFRVGAVDQLRKFADTVRVPLLAASNRKEFQSALRAFSARQVVLVDTAGQNPRDIDLLRQLDSTLNAAENHERHLVMSAPTKERDLGAFIELYRSIGFDYLLFSKLDETATYGGLLNAYLIGERPFSYFTTGQRVPEDIEEASSGRLNELLFN
jgi:flagellar biosynthesis protein FlhF